MAGGRDRKAGEPAPMVSIPLTAVQQAASGRGTAGRLPLGGAGTVDAVALANKYQAALTMAAMGFHEAATEALVEITARAPAQAAPWRDLAALFRLAARDAEADGAIAQAERVAGRQAPWPSPLDARMRDQFAPAEAKINDMLRDLPPEEHMNRLREILLGSPRAVVAMRLLAQYEWNDQDWCTSIQLLQRAVALAPGYAGARADLVRLFMEQRAFWQALTHTGQLVADAPDDPLYLAMHVDALRSVGKVKEALTVMERLTAAHPDKAGVWSVYAQLMQFLGRRDEAVQACRTCLRLEPGNGEAYWNLSELKGNYVTDADVAAMRALVANDKHEPSHRIRIYYALASALERRKDYEGSFAAYAKGAWLWRETAGRSGVRYDHALTRREVAARKQCFSVSRMQGRLASPERAAAAADRFGATPIFVVGMPRAGSTLLEQILGSHSLVEPTRELPVIEEIVRELMVSRAMVTPYAYPQRVLELSEDELAALGRRYIAEAGKYRSTKLPYFIDKRPWNWLDVGLIHLILPHAKILDMRRAPMAACFAMFKQLLPNDAAFSYDLGDLGRYYNEYAGLMQHWQAVLPGLVRPVSYEALVENADAEITALLADCGLPFEAGCLRFWETDRMVATPSAEQVRRPIFRDALEQWRHFEPWLAKAAAALAEPALA
jgi:tetratricopeptide (TPR) repeat protein